MSRILFGGLAAVATTNDPNDYLPEEIGTITFGVLVVIFLIWLLKKPERFGKFCFGLVVLIAVTWIWKKTLGDSTSKAGDSQPKYHVTIEPPESKPR